MTDDRKTALRYLRAPANGCWRWADAGTVLVWHDGTTVAFREEIALILEVLAPQGLPPFDALALLLAACKGKFQDPAKAFRAMPATLAPDTRTGAGPAQPSQMEGDVHPELVLAGLRQLEQLPPEVIGHVCGKAVLAHAVFETAAIGHRVDPSAVLENIRQPFSDAELNGASDNFAVTQHLRHLEAISLALKAHTAESLVLRLRTGLDALLKPVGLQLTPGESARRLLDELSQDQEHMGLARAARELLAAVRLPRRLEPEETLSVGGVADLSNRGPLDRLLVSELAHDDFTLAGTRCPQGGALPPAGAAAPRAARGAGATVGFRRAAVGPAARLCHGGGPGLGRA